VIVETRPRVYPAREKVFPKYVATTNGWRRVRNEWNDDPGGVGREIVRALRVCPSCAATLASG
jgi:hypothetical protein